MESEIEADQSWDGETWWKRIWRETRWRLRWQKIWVQHFIWHYWTVIYLPLYYVYLVRAKNMDELVAGNVEDRHRALHHKQRGWMSVYCLNHESNYTPMGSVVAIDQVQFLPWRRISLCMCTNIVACCHIVLLNCVITLCYVIAKRKDFEPVPRKVCQKHTENLSHSSIVFLSTTCA